MALLDPDESFDVWRHEAESVYRPLSEDKVLTRPVEMSDIGAFNPFAEGPLSTTRAMQLRIWRRLLNAGPFSLTDPVFDKPGGGRSRRRSSGHKLIGAYAIFYCGDHALYRNIRSHASKYPLYGGGSEDLFARMAGHRQTLHKSDLGLDHCTVRFVIVDEDLKDFAEKAIHRLCYPLWVEVLRGFGTPGTGTSDINPKRAGQHRSPWDTVHNVARGTGSVHRHNRDVLIQLVKHAIPTCLSHYHRLTEELNGDVPGSVP